MEEIIFYKFYNCCNWRHISHWSGLTGWVWRLRVEVVLEEAPGSGGEQITMIYVSHGRDWQLTAPLWPRIWWMGGSNHLTRPTITQPQSARPSEHSLPTNSLSSSLSLSLSLSLKTIYISSLAAFNIAHGCLWLVMVVMVAHKAPVFVWWIIIQFCNFQLEAKT